MLSVGAHSLYYRVEGSPEGVPVFIFHGGWGPRDSDGACCDDDDEEGQGRWRVIHLHQRGWGKSLPFGETRENSAADVIGDVERLREHLGIEHWIVVGGSTGAMLALLYGVEFPEAVQGIVLRGTWLLRKKEIDWCYRGGMGHFYPEANHYRIR
jgi:proline iminopeptidase